MVPIPVPPFVIPATNAGAQGGDGGGGGAFALIAMNGEKVKDTTFLLSSGTGGASAAENVIEKYIGNTLQAAAVILEIFHLVQFALPIPTVGVNIRTSKSGSAGTSSCLYKVNSDNSKECLIEAGAGQGGGSAGDGVGGAGGKVTEHKKTTGIVLMSALSGKKGGTRGDASGHVEWVPFGRKDGKSGESYSDKELID